MAAALLNAIKVTGKEMGTLRVVINGAGAAGIAIGKHLINMGFGNVILCDINGIICEGDEGLNPGQEENFPYQQSGSRAWHSGRRFKKCGRLYRAYPVPDW